MKRHRFDYTTLLAILPLTLLLVITSCEKSYNSTYKDFLGTWVSTDLADTIKFATYKDLYKMYSGVKDHFDYSLSKDKITIRYNGILMILVYPTTHTYNINGDQLTIDFRPSCYGFRDQEIIFIKE